MAFCRAAKRSLRIVISNRLLNNGSRHGFSNNATNMALVVEGVKYGSSVPFVHDAGSVHNSRLCLLRRFSVETLAGSDQTSLIKQLRERTIAPIKDVKAALIDCNRDIECLAFCCFNRRSDDFKNQATFSTFNCYVKRILS